MHLELTGRVVLVTGGAKGIGAAIVRECAAEGAVPVIVDRDEEAANKFADELRSSGATVHVICTDLCHTMNCESAVRRAAELGGSIGALVNNAGVNDGVGLERGTPEKFVGSLRTNLLHYYNMAHFALPHLKKTQGPIVNIASKTAVTGQGGTSGYVAAKGGILGLTREWAVELLPYNIRVNAVVPAEVMTPLYQQWLSTFPKPDEKLASITAKIPLGKRMTCPEEIAAAVVFLLSPRAGHITGQHIFVDGGYVHLDRSLT